MQPFAVCASKRACEVSLLCNSYIYIRSFNVYNKPVGIYLNEYTQPYLYNI